MKYFLCLFITVLSLAGCAKSEIPSYILTTSELHRYQGGDSLSYSILSIGNNSEATGILTLRYEAADLLTPNFDVRKTLIRKTETQGNIQFPFATPVFTQNERGDLILEGYSDSSNTYWLTESESADTGETFYSSPLSDVSDINIDQTLFVCDNTICNNAGSSNLQLQLSAIEQIETDYAKFETYRIRINWEVTIQSNDPSVTLKTYRISGTQWLFPPLGVVRFEYTMETKIGDSTTVIGILNATNINIPVANKSE